MQYTVPHGETSNRIDMPDARNPRATTVQSIVRALRILEALSEQSAVSLTELSRSLGLHKSTIHRLLNTLQGEGYVRQNPLTDRYSLGWKILGLASGLSAHLDIRQYALPVMQRLMTETQETIHLGTLGDDEVICLESVVSGQPNAIGSMAGKHTHAHVSSMGKVILAYSPEEDVRAFLARRGLPRLTARTITDQASFAAELWRIRSDHYALNDEEEALGIRCVAAPIWDHRGQPVAALSVAAPSARLDPVRVRALSKQLIERAEEISRALGGV